MPALLAGPERDRTDLCSASAFHRFESGLEVLAANTSHDVIDAIRRVLAADIESFRRIVERYSRPRLARRKAAKVDVMRRSNLQ
jgi:hypothetical protein